MSCRFSPDLDSLEKFWEFLAAGRSSVREMPDKRWEPYARSHPRATAILRHTTRLGSFLDDIEGFDADFFGITPREADFLDPQQRIALELAWEALAHAGIPPLSLRGSDAGVFVAANSNDYGRRLLEDIPRTGAYSVNGTTYYGIANRISYFLDLRGPSVAVDTACAGSLTALHYACQSLRLGEVPVAIVGGINVMATPALFVALDAAGATAPDGRSKAFDKVADGYGRGEGAGVVVLKRLSDARRDGDPVLALIVGSGVFQDGRSDGMMAPNERAQQHMLREVYARAGVPPSTVSYVEAHGTGTPTGDRAEALAMAEVFGADRRQHDPCLIGSLKPNIGHIEGGSGIAGVIKTVLAMQHEKIPPSLHSEPSPTIDWAGLRLRLVGELTPWPSGNGARRAGVSSYGVGGTIAHLILQEPPATSARPQPAERGEPTVFPLSAMSEAGLRAFAAATADWLTEHPDVPLSSVGHTLSRRRSHLPQRAGIVAGSAAELTARLRDLAAERRSPGLVTARTSATQPVAPVWVFSGHGAQWSGMGQRLLREEPAFGRALDSIADVFREEMGWTPREALTSGGPWSPSEVQALTFAMQIGLIAVWRRHGVSPGAIIGHSVGEIAAAVAAGCIQVEDAARFACRRANALRQLEGQGAMALVGLSFAECRERLAGRDDVVAAIAASPQSTVISGDRHAVEHVAAELQQDGIDVRRVATDIAFHSPHVEAVMAEVGAAARQIHPRVPKVTLYSTALADPRSSEPRNADYWVANLRQPVRFADAVAAAVEDGHRVFLELSSHPVVTHSINETLQQLDVEDGRAVASTRRDLDEVLTILGGLADLYCHGAAIDWTAEHPDGHLVALPAMAWQHRPYWIFPEASGGTELDRGGHDPDRHSLLGARMTIGGGPVRQVWQTYLDMSCRPYPLSHEVAGVEITPAASLIETFTSAAARNGVRPALTDIVLRTPVAVTPSRVVQIVLADNTIRLATRIADDEAAAGEEHEWITHTTAVVDPDRKPPQGELDVAAIRGRCDRVAEWSQVDDMFRTMGVGGYAFPWQVDELRRNDEEQLALVTLEPPPALEAGTWAHVIDGALTLSAVVVTPEDARRLWMSCHIDTVAFHGAPPSRIVVHSRRSTAAPHDTVDVLVGDERGRIVCEVTGLRFAPLQDEPGVVAAPRDLVHEVVWRPLDLDRTAQLAQRRTVNRVRLVGGATATQLAVLLERAGVRCDVLASPEDLRPESLSEVDAVLVAPGPADIGQPPETAAEGFSWSLVQTAQKMSVAYEAQDPSAILPKLWCLTQAVRESRGEESLALAPLWGVARIIAGEHPELWGGLVDVTELDADTGTRLLGLLRDTAGAEDVICLTGDTAAVPRLSRIQRVADGTPLQCHPSSTYLITGGLGSLGLAVAEWLVNRGARRLLLASRRGLPGRDQWGEIRDPRTRRKIETILSLEAQGATVQALSLDITDAEQVARALDPAAHGLPPIRGIIHAAGVVRDAMVDKVDRDGLHDVLAAKATAGMVLHRLFPPGSLDFFVLFSSCGQFARLTGQTSYAAGNSFLDALARHRTVDGHTDTVSMAWTAWRGMGMSETIASTMLEANARGLEAISAAEAFGAWAFAERFREPYKAILRVLPLPASTPRVPMFRELTATDAGTGSLDSQLFTIDWTGLSDDEVLELVTADVGAQVAAELNLADGEVELKRPLVELGVDSVMTVAIRVRLQRRYGLEVPPNILWSRPTVAALAEHIIENLKPQSTSEQ